jgi:DNA polymerase I-like protein with 3'-5' exonuclease and polymerase domains
VDKDKALDAYRLKASKIYKTPYDKVTPAQRQAAKLSMWGEIHGVNIRARGYRG